MTVDGCMREVAVLGVRSAFAGQLALAASIALVTVLAAVALLTRRRAQGRPAQRSAARVLAVGAAAVVVAATAAPGSWPPVLADDGDLALRPGHGGLADWRVLLEDPGSLAAVLLVANVLLYVPLGLAARVGWTRTLPVLAAVTALSLAVEAAQWQALGRVASTDDVLLNVAGGAVGVLLALAVLGRHPRSGGPS